ncbi:MAG: hypothetical protein L6R39_006314 [Caloplaca ligustica]|nr:MAG: hypothetical protein L6R39_006314 [Caloplaca ligustica]
MADNRKMTEKSSVANVVASDGNSNSDSNENVPGATSTSKGWRFWVIFLAICVATLVIAVDVSIVSTALPTIADDLGSEALFVWVANAYILATTVVQPIFGQMANIFGRRSLTIIAVLIFMLGSGLAGGASSTGMLIGARTVQGVGGGGIITLGEIIICDLVPLLERGQYSGLLAGTYAIGTIIGPLLGGLFTDRTSWRWVFYINLPICGAALLLIVPFLNLKYRREGTIWDRLKRVDWVGNALLTAAVTSILLALAWAGTKHAWGSWRTLVPLILGVLGMLGFAAIQWSGYVDEPTTPPKLFSNRTSIAVFVMAFVHGLLLLWVIYFLPVYFQAVRGSTPTRSGVQILPIATTIAPAAAISGILVTITGHYRVFHFVGFALMSAGAGSMATLDASSTTGAWVGFQLLFGLGNGMVFNTMIPPLLASLPSSEVATATATWTFMRSFGSIWGIAIPSSIFNDRINRLVAQNLSDQPSIGALLVKGGAYEKATATFIHSLPPGADNIREKVVQVYVDALQIVFYAIIPFAVLGIPIALFIRGYKLTNEMETEFGMEESKKKGGNMVASNDSPA